MTRHFASLSPSCFALWPTQLEVAFARRPRGRNLDASLKRSKQTVSRTQKVTCSFWPMPAHHAPAVCPARYMPSINFNKRLQRNKRYFGFFFCHRCKLRWRSSHAYQRHYQKCSECGRKTYPNSLKVLDTKFRDYAPGEEETDGEVDQTHKGPHLQSSCQRCKKLGRPCMNEPRGEWPAIFMVISQLAAPDRYALLQAGTAA